VARSARLAAVVYAVALCAYVADRVTKGLAVRYLADRGPVTIVPHVLDLSYTTNSGGAFSVFPNHPWLFFAASALVCVGIVIASWRLTSPWVAVGLGLILGGALGNLTDRVVRGSGVSGRVVDFIHLHLWPVFNVADSCIVVGVFVAVIASSWGRASATGG
jgi:signal peptidase II